MLRPLGSSIASGVSAPRSAPAPRAPAASSPQSEAGDSAQLSSLSMAPASTERRVPGAGRKAGLALALTLAAAMLPGLASAATTAVDEATENALIGGRNVPGRLVEIGQGAPRGGTVVTVHGINGSPLDVQKLSDRAHERGAHVFTFAYDDRHRSQSANAEDLADELGGWMRQHPGQLITIQAHSMGGRISVAALSELQARGQLTSPVQLDLVAPPLGGFASGNWAGLAPGFLGSVIGGLRPGEDMGTRSSFQKALETTTLPSHVQTRIFVGDQDEIVDSTMPGFTRTAESLRAPVVHFPHATHDSAIDDYAALPPQAWNLSDRR